MEAEEGNEANGRLTKKMRQGMMKEKDMRDREQIKGDVEATAEEREVARQGRMKRGSRQRETSWIKGRWRGRGERKRQQGKYG